MTVFLLDVNLLLALSDPMHAHHEPAHRWFATHGARAWATCPLTENGFVRIASHPSYPNGLGTVGASLAMLRQFCDHDGHEFWPESVSLRNVLTRNTVLTHKHIPDAYLLALAVEYNGKLATLDQRIPASAVEGGLEALEVVVARS